MQAVNHWSRPQVMLQHYLLVRGSILVASGCVFHGTMESSIRCWTFPPSKNGALPHHERVEGLGEPEGPLG